MPVEGGREAEGVGAEAKIGIDVSADGIHIMPFKSGMDDQGGMMS